MDPADLRAGAGSMSLSNPNRSSRLPSRGGHRPGAATASELLDRGGVCGTAASRASCPTTMPISPPAASGVGHLTSRPPSALWALSAEATGLDPLGWEPVRGPSRRRVGPTVSTEPARSKRCDGEHLPAGIRTWVTLRHTILKGRPTHRHSQEPQCVESSRGPPACPDRRPPGDRADRRGLSCHDVHLRVRTRTYRGVEGRTTCPWATGMSASSRSVRQSRPVNRATSSSGSLIISDNTCESQAGFQVEVRARVVRARVGIRRNAPGSVCQWRLVATPGTLPDLLPRCSPPPTCSAPDGSPPMPPPADWQDHRDGRRRHSSVPMAVGRQRAWGKRIIAMSRRRPLRQNFRALASARPTSLRRGEAGVARIKEARFCLGARSVVEAVGTQSPSQALSAARGGLSSAMSGSTRVQITGIPTTGSPASPLGGPAPVRHTCHLIRRIWTADQPRRGLRPPRCRSRMPPRATGPWTTSGDRVMLT